MAARYYTFVLSQIKLSNIKTAAHFTPPVLRTELGQEKGGCFCGVWRVACGVWGVGEYGVGCGGVWCVE